MDLRWRAEKCVWPLLFLFCGGRRGEGRVAKLLFWPSGGIAVNILRATAGYAPLLTCRGEGEGGGREGGVYISLLCHYSSANIMKCAHKSLSMHEHVQIL